MQHPSIFDKEVLELAKKLPKQTPEPFKALEEYDRTHKLRRWDNKVRVNFTLDPKTYKEFKRYCEKKGYKMSTLVERLIKKTVK
ncbi:hypothetical protein CMO88_01335 [Candidatus Woesearchaeota archaeon]|nr:hypothetical protein [Candidatus Woesearchaeota archaeon]|tara:strand:+ start:17042 stop:17293 length:252 start_codon:yes stop_codon:yes gene_type:complete